MCIVVHCDIEYCTYNRNGICGRESHSVTRKTFSGFRNGEREWSPACKEYKELGDDGTD